MSEPLPKRSAVITPVSESPITTRVVPERILPEEKDLYNGFTELFTMGLDNWLTYFAAKHPEYSVFTSFTDVINYYSLIELNLATERPANPQVVFKDDNTLYFSTAHPLLYFGLHVYVNDDYGTVSPASFILDYYYFTYEQNEEQEGLQLLSIECCERNLRYPFNIYDNNLLLCNTADSNDYIYDNPFMSGFKVFEEHYFALCQKIESPIVFNRLMFECFENDYVRD